jgi:hypothetical protein
MKQPSYNRKGETKGVNCASHKKEGMVDVKHLTCQKYGCKTRPNYNFEGESNGIYCASHKKEGMVNVKDRTCQETGCKKQPSYNVKGETKGVYCASHKREGMINVKSSTCQESGCKTIPNYNYNGEITALYCVSHKKEGMMNVKHLTCQKTGCKTRPSYNVKGETKGVYCVSHKKEGMVNVISRTCQESECKKQPSYNFEGETKGIYCTSHKKEGMIDVVNRTCRSSWCYTHVTEKYDGYCLSCFVHLFPDKPNARNYKTKERAVAEYVLAEFPDKTWIADKRIADGCSKRRPDLCLDMGSHLLMVEVDENQHTDYDCSCENKRIMEISRDVGHRPVVFLRFNPDDYIKDGKNCTSCWGIDKKGFCVVKKSKQGEWGHRLQCLKDQINYWIQHTPEKMVEVVQLFFDYE